MAVRRDAQSKDSQLQTAQQEVLGYIHLFAVCNVLRYQFLNNFYSCSSKTRTSGSERNINRSETMNSRSEIRNIRFYARTSRSGTMNSSYNFTSNRLMIIFRKILSIAVGAMFGNFIE